MHPCTEVADQDGNGLGLNIYNIIAKISVRCCHVLKTRVRGSPERDIFFLHGMGLGTQLRRVWSRRVGAAAAAVVGVISFFPGGRSAPPDPPFKSASGLP